MYGRQGIVLDHLTLAEWVGRAAFLLRPGRERLLDKLKGSPRLFADETTAPLLDATRCLPGRTRRRWPSAGATSAASSTNWPGPAPIAGEALARIAKLYCIEGEIPGRSAEERHRVRQQRSRPFVEALEPWLRTKIQLISPMTKLAEETRYAISRRQGPFLFLDDGHVEIDNTSSCEPSGSSRSPARTPSSPAPTAAPSIGRSSPPHQDLQAHRCRTIPLSRRRHHPHPRRPPAKPAL